MHTLTCVIIVLTIFTLILRFCETDWLLQSLDNLESSGGEIIASYMWKKYAIDYLEMRDLR